jgi:flagellar capping protein FliD
MADNTITKISMRKLNKISEQNEAQTIYEMLKCANSLFQGNAVTMTVSNNTASYNITGNTLTLTYQSGNTIIYVDPDPTGVLVPSLNLADITIITTIPTSNI